MKEKNNNSQQGERKMEQIILYEYEIEIQVSRSTTGREIWGDCPWCGKTGKFYRNGDSGYFRFSCPTYPEHDIYPGIIKNNLFTIE